MSRTEQREPAAPTGAPREEPLRPAAQGPGAAALDPAQRWVVAIDHPSLMPLVCRPKGWAIATIAMASVLMLAAFALNYQWATGLGMTGMSNQTPWTLYIVNFVFFIGASAGGIIVSSLTHALGIDRFKPVARLAEVTALTCLVVAAIFITLDIGRPDRIWHLLRYGDPSSPLVWDVAVITAYGLLAFALVYYSVRADLVRLMATFPRRRRLYRLLALGDTDVSPEALARDERRLRLLSILSIPAAVLVHSVTAWILGLVKSQPGWHTAILAPLFIVSAIVSGVALTALAGLVSRNLLHIRVCDHAIDALGRILCFSIPVLAYFLVAELLTEIYPREPSALHVMRETIVGRYAPVFWFQIFASLVVPFVILASRRLRTTTGVGIASLLVVLGVLAERWNIVIPPLTGHTYLPYAMAGYAPTFLELALTLGVYAGGVLVYLVVTRLLPMVRLDVEQGARP